MSAVAIFRALGEPTRLQMIERLSTREVHTINSISQGLGLTRQGARKHLQILADAHVVILHQKGRDTLVELDTRQLVIVKRFIIKLELQWDKRLEALRDYIDKK